MICCARTFLWKLTHDWDQYEVRYQINSWAVAKGCLNFWRHWYGCGQLEEMPSGVSWVCLEVFALRALFHGSFLGLAGTVGHAPRKYNEEE